MNKILQTIIADFQQCNYNGLTHNHNSTCAKRKFTVHVPTHKNVNVCRCNHFLEKPKFDFKGIHFYYNNTHSCKTTVNKPKTNFFVLKNTFAYPFIKVR